MTMYGLSNFYVKHAATLSLILSLKRERQSMNNPVQGFF